MGSDLPQAEGRRPYGEGIRNHSHPRGLSPPATQPELGDHPYIGSFLGQKVRKTKCSIVIEVRIIGKQQPGRKLGQPGDQKLAKNKEQQKPGQP